MNENARLKSIMRVIANNIRTSINACPNHKAKNVIQKQLSNHDNFSNVILFATQDELAKQTSEYQADKTWRDDMFHNDWQNE